MSCFIRATDTTWSAYSETYQPLIAGSGEPIRSLRGTRWKYVHQEGAAPELAFTGRGASRRSSRST